MVCKNEQTIMEKRTTLANWVRSDPGNILVQAKKMNSSTPYLEYIADLNRVIKSKFQRGCNPEKRTLERERIIVRYVVYMNLEMMGKSNKGCPLTTHRNMETLVEASTRSRNEDSVDRGPVTSVKQQLQHAHSFFDANDRIRIGVTHKPIENTPRLTVESLDGVKADWSTGLDWTQLRVATLQEVRMIHHRLLIRLPFCELHLYHYPMEIYMAWRLHETYHVYENHGLHSTRPSGQALPHASTGVSSTYTVSDNGPIERFPDTLMVVRPGSYIYDDSFPPSSFKLPIAKLIMFLWRNGKSDATRSSGWRLDFGNAGQASESIAGQFQPKLLCGTGTFDSDPDGPLIRSTIGVIVDGLCKGMKQMSREMGQPLVLNERRYQGYAQHLQDYLFAKELFIEHVTLQMLDLSAGDSGVEHLDASNDPRVSYNSTVAKVMHFIGPSGNLISLKVLCSFRKRIGDYYSLSYAKIEKVLIHIHTMLEEVNMAYQRLGNHHRGCMLVDRPATWDNINPLFLNERSPWKTKQITPSIRQRSIQILTGVGRNLWLSAAWTQIHRLGNSYDERGVVQLLMVTAWQNSFQRFWEVCCRMEQYQSESFYPIYEYYRVARELFYEPGKEKGQEMYGGEDPRFGPIGFDFKDVFGTVEHQKRDVVDRIVDIILDMCDVINGFTDHRIDHTRVLGLVESTAQKIRIEGRCELGPFRLMIVLQSCAYLGVRLRRRANMRDIFFPVKGSGSWSHLSDAGVPDANIESACLEIQRELSTTKRFVWMEEVEAVLCESKPGRLLQKYDTFIFGQNLFQMDDDGIVWIKHFGDKNWNMFASTHAPMHFGDTNWNMFASTHAPLI